MPDDADRGETGQFDRAEVDRSECDSDTADHERAPSSGVGRGEEGPLEAEEALLSLTRKMCLLETEQFLGLRWAGLLVTYLKLQYLLTVWPSYLTKTISLAEQT